MRSLSFLLLAACTAPTDSAATDTATDSDADTDSGDTGTDSGDTGTDTGDTGTDTADTGTDTGDTDTGTALDMDFVDNGPGEGVFFFVSDLQLGDNACEVNSNRYSLTMLDSITLSHVNPDPQVFDEQATASENQIVGCTYHLEGDFWCSATSRGMNLGEYDLDATISWGLEMGGTFGEHTVDVDGTPHTFSQRWAADLEWSYTMTCAGSDCAAAATMAGVTLPCETVGTVEAVNYDDPTLVKAE